MRKAIVDAINKEMKALLACETGWEYINARTHRHAIKVLEELLEHYDHTN